MSYKVKSAVMVIIYLLCQGQLGAQEMDLEFMNYEALMAGKTPIQVEIPTEKGRGPQSILDMKRSSGKNIERAPALEDVNARRELKKGKYQ